MPRAEPVESVMLQFSEELPSSNSLQEHENIMQREAEQIHRTLFHHVAQGVRHKLVILLMQEMTEGYIGPHSQPHLMEGE